MLEGIRKVDELGRIVLPLEMRKSLDIGDKEPVHISFNGKEIVIKKQGRSCVFCRSSEVSEEINGKYICRNCINRLSEYCRP